MKKSVLILAAMSLLMSMTACNGTDAGSSDSRGNSGLISPPSSESTVQSNQATQSTQNSSDGSESSWSSVSTGDSPNVDIPPDGGMSGSVFVLENGMGIELYGGGYSRGANYANSLNEIKAKVGDKVNVFSMVAPTSGSLDRKSVV